MQWALPFDHRQNSFISLLHQEVSIYNAKTQSTSFVYAIENKPLANAPIQ